MPLDAIHRYWAEISALAGAFIWLARLEFTSRRNVREITERAAQDIMRVKMRLDDHDAKMTYMQTEARNNSIQLTQILVELQAVKTGLEYIKAEMMRR